MPDRRETGKDRWKRVPKDYFKKPDRLQRTKLLLSLIAGALSFGWFASGVDWSGRSGSSTSLNSLRANHGELARVHAAWAERCDACHVPFEAIGGRPLLATGSDASARSSDKLCMSCHAGPAHHAATRQSDLKGCAECHRDHQGRDFSIVRLGDDECTNCHSALDAHTAPDPKPRGSRVFAASISSFREGDHPPFRSKFADYGKPSSPIDRGKLNFNHQLHMSPGLTRQPGDRPYTLSRVPVASERVRYGEDPGEPVRLDCYSCHVLDAGDLPGESSITPSTPRSRGDYYLPVDYRMQCRACHPLSYDSKNPKLEAPHGVQPGEVTAYLRGTYAAQLFSENPKLLDEFRPKITLPGRSPFDPVVRKRFEEAVSAAESALFEYKTNCKECHQYSGGIDHGVVPARVELPNVPGVWYTHASFDHTAHRAVSCRECHSRAYALEADGKTAVKDASKTQADVLIPAMDHCVRCHAPSRSERGWFDASPAPPGGASASCVECHRYHNGDRPLQGEGAAARRAGAERTIANFLEGGAGRPPSVPAAGQ